MTNVGIVLPDAGLPRGAARADARRTGTLLIIDETHTLCAGPGGYTRAHGLEPDLLTIGKAIGGGVPCGAYGLSGEVAARVLGDTIWETADAGGVGGTLAANALSLAAMRATLCEVLTDEAFAHMIAAGRALRARGSHAAIDELRPALARASASAAAPNTSSSASDRAAAPRRPPRWTSSLTPSCTSTR